jgi:hypothetical protein
MRVCYLDGHEAGQCCYLVITHRKPITSVTAVLLVLRLVTPHTCGIVGGKKLTSLKTLQIQNTNRSSVEDTVVAPNFGTPDDGRMCQNM